jgi:hypothetical protein
MVSHLWGILVCLRTVKHSVRHGDISVARERTDCLLQSITLNMLWDRYS